jgi:hypothetical protein
MKTIQTILLKYLTLGYDRIEIDYHGGGDSGSVESIMACFSGAIGEPVDDEDHTFLENYFFANLDPLIQGDWVNNDGGSGCCSINTSTGEYSLETKLFFTDYTLDNHSGSLIDVDEKEEN